MGVKNAHNFIEKSKVDFVSKTFQEYLGDIPVGRQIHVDLLGCMFWYIKRRIFQADMVGLSKWLAKVFKSPKVVVVVDGQGQSQEKAAVHQSRREARQADLAALEAFRSELQRRQRWTKNDHKKKGKLLLAAFDFKVQLPELCQLLRQEGVQVVEADMEADVYIASRTNATVVSKDSDFWFHRNVQSFAKFSGRDGQKIMVEIYRRDKVLSALGISEGALTALGIVSGNDYSQNIRGKGLVRNLRLFRENNWVALNFPSDICARYSEMNALPRDHFRNALAVFNFATETPMGGQGPPAPGLYDELKAWFEGHHRTGLPSRPRRKGVNTPVRYRYFQGLNFKFKPIGEKVEKAYRGILETSKVRIGAYYQKKSKKQRARAPEKAKIDVGSRSLYQPAGKRQRTQQKPKVEEVSDF